MKAGNSMELAVAGVAFVIFVAIIFVYLTRENSEAKAFADAHKALLTRIESANHKLDDLTAMSERLAKEVEAAHSQADSAKSRAEAADHLAHKVAMDLAKRPVQSMQAHSGPVKIEPVKFEPIRIVIYDKRDLKKKTETVKHKDAEKTLKQ